MDHLHHHRPPDDLIQVEVLPVLDLPADGRFHPHPELGLGRELDGAEAGHLAPIKLPAVTDGDLDTDPGPVLRVILFLCVPGNLCLVDALIHHNVVTAGCLECESDSHWLLLLRMFH